jgi:hypothetical protein
MRWDTNICNLVPLTGIVKLNGTPPEERIQVKGSAPAPGVLAGTLASHSHKPQRVFTFQ